MTIPGLDIDIDKDKAALEGEGGQAASSSFQDKKELLKQKAKQRTMLLMQKNADAFSAFAGISDSEDDDENDDENGDDSESEDLKVERDLLAIGTAIAAATQKEAADAVKAEKEAAKVRTYVWGGVGCMGVYLCVWCVVWVVVLVSDG